MKKLIIVFAVALITFSAQSQNVINRSAIYESEIVSISDNSGLYAYSSGLKIDDSGIISGKVLSFHENGNLDESGTLIKGQKHGEWIRFGSDGTKLNEANYKLGKKDGVWKVWDEEGNLRMRYEFDDGKRVGQWISYDADGNILNEKNY